MGRIWVLLGRIWVLMGRIWDVLGFDHNPPYQNGSKYQNRCNNPKVAAQNSTSSHGLGKTSFRGRPRERDGMSRQEFKVTCSQALT